MRRRKVKMASRRPRSSRRKRRKFCTRSPPTPTSRSRSWTKPSCTSPSQTKPRASTKSVSSGRRKRLARSTCTSSSSIESARPRSRGCNPPSGSRSSRPIGRRSSRSGRGSRQPRRALSRRRRPTTTRRRRPSTSSWLRTCATSAMGSPCSSTSRPRIGPFARCAGSFTSWPRPSRRTSTTPTGFPSRRRTCSITTASTSRKTWGGRHSVRTAWQASPRW
mmetsp:Transcript_121530/g.343821  ORF Transcript_121530/g.343821 Transcript_121530/m.343821 type:complete len:220 (-) Transcript_121530:377-1036(-)